MEKLANNIVKLRVMNGLSQEDLAYKIGVSRQTVHKWEKSITSPKGDNLKLLCEAFEVGPDELFGKKPLILDKKIEIAIDELKTDLKEQDAETKEKSKKELKRKLTKCILIILLVLISTYACYTAYKFTILTNIEDNISKYEKLENYYCEIETYNNEKLYEKKKIWYKNQKYKIESINYNDMGDSIRENTTIINLEDSTKIVYDDDSNNGKTRELRDKEKYVDGSYMYNLFPDIMKKSKNNKMENSFGFKEFKYKFDKISNEYSLIIDNIQTRFQKDTYIPTFYLRGNSDSIVKQYFTIVLENVNENDLNF